MACMKAWISLGSNLGDRAGTLLSAFAALEGLPGVTGAVLSPCYETDPVGPEQPAYLNACARLEAEGLDPRWLLEQLLAIEARHGRVRAGRWGPRTLDLDLLLVDDRKLEEPGLTLPHPRLCERLFVLKPLVDLDPGLEVPWTGRAVAELASALPPGGVRPFRWPGRKREGKGAGHA